MARAGLLALLACATAIATPAAFAAECPAPGPEGAPPPPLVVPAGTRIGLALGSGSMHGYAHLGVLKEIEARALPVWVVTGTSVGAIVGSLWASGMKEKDIEALAQRENLSDMGSPSGSWQGLLSNDPLRVTLDSVYGGRPIESWPRRFGAVATNLANGERRLIMQGDAATAVQASSAVPVLYRPIVVDGENLGDGALVEPVPVVAARDMGANLVIGVDVAYRPYEESVSGISGYAFQAMHILVNTLATEQLRTADVSIRLNLHHRYIECGRDALVQAGREAVRRAWPELAHVLALRRKEARASP